MPSALNSTKQFELDVKAVRRTLLGFEDKMAKKIVRRGVRAGAAYMRDEARKFVPIRYGVLKKHIYARADRSRDRNEIRAVVTIRKGTVMVGGEKVNPRRYAHLVEFGTRHSKAQPFFRPAMANEVAIRDAILVKIKADVAKELGR